ncbi:MAG: hypothetical protein EU551_04595 [Promethearchaeota archaeon]|nr:MAG: hypothetical protein EU551_04595 [Candidatus Lokiarchaeota archaeon]
MAHGIILLDWNKQKGPVVAASYFEKEGIKFEQHYATRTFLTHASHGWEKNKVQEQLYLQFNGITMASHYFSIQREQMIRRIIIAIILRNDEKPEQYFKIIKEISPKIINNIDLPQTEMNDLLKEIYSDKIKNVTAKFTSNDVKNMVPLMKEEFREVIEKDKTITGQIINNFGELGLEVLKNLPQDLRIENLAGAFHANIDDITSILIWAAEKGYIRLLRL